MSKITKAVIIIIVTTIYFFNSTRSTTLHKKQEQGILHGGVKEGVNFHHGLPNPIFFRPDQHVQLCGPRLTAAVQMLCRQLGIKQQSKRNSPVENHGENHNAIFKRSIVDECCKKPCTQRSLLKFCVREDPEPTTTTTTTTTPAPVLPEPTPTRSGLPMELLKAIFKLVLNTRMHPQPIAEEKPVSNRNEVENHDGSNPESSEDVDPIEESKAEEREKPYQIEDIYTENDDIISAFSV